MITQEQAEQIVIRERGGKNEFFEREARIESLELVTVTEDDPVHHGNEMGIVEWEPLGWSVNFAWRDKEGDSDTWGHWSHGHCYVVEAKPGPYVIK